MQVTSQVFLPMRVPNESGIALPRAAVCRAQTRTALGLEALTVNVWATESQVPHSTSLAAASWTGEPSAVFSAAEATARDWTADRPLGMPAAAYRAAASAACCNSLLVICTWATSTPRETKPTREANITTTSGTTEPLQQRRAGNAGRCGAARSRGKGTDG